MTAIVILAAGASSRMGRPKQIEELGGESLLARSVRVAADAGIGEVYLVVSPDHAVVVAEAGRLRCRVVLNGESEEGMSSSIRAGVRALGETATAAIVMTCDQPAVTSSHLRLLETAGDGDVVASEYAGRRGVPACFPASMFQLLAELRGDAGARELLREVRAIELKDGEADIDTVGDMEAARLRFRGREAG